VKRTITNEIYVDSVLTNTLIKTRAVYKDRTGEYVKDMGNKKYLLNDTYRTEYRSITKG
jgi:hypothetical protein